MGKWSPLKPAEFVCSQQNRRNSRAFWVYWFSQQGFRACLWHARHVLPLCSVSAPPKYRCLAYLEPCWYHSARTCPSHIRFSFLLLPLDTRHPINFRKQRAPGNWTAGSKAPEAVCLPWPWGSIKRWVSHFSLPRWGWGNLSQHRVLNAGNTLVPILEVVLLPAVNLFTLDPGLGCGVSLTLWTACSSMGKLGHRWEKNFWWKSWTTVLGNNSNTYSKFQALNQAPYLNYLVSSSLKTLWVRGYNTVLFT